MDNFDNAFKTHFDGVVKIANDYKVEHYPSLGSDFFSVEPGSRYLKIVKDNGTQRMVFSFVDKKNGDVLKPASWRAPAKHARGNIFDAKNGLGSIGPYGPAYLR